jgi:hypothetical protein
MRERWEYLSLTWTHEREKIAPGEYKWTQTYWVYWPGQEEAEKRHVWDSDTKEYKEALQDTLNGFGQEGWELVSETTLNSVVFSEQQGVEMVGSPISMRWMFKRPVAD